LGDDHPLETLECHIPIQFSKSVPLVSNINVIREYYKVNNYYPIGQMGWGK